MDLSLEAPLQTASGFADLGSWVATALAIAVLVLVVTGTFLERSRQVSASGSTMLFLGLTILPVFMMLFGAFASIEQAKSVEFCHSCHTAMNPYVADMLDRDSTTLAAIHANERFIPRDPCYRCHANYGVWGEADAKIRGFAHLYHWLLGSPTALGLEQIETYEPYSNTTCLECHAGGTSFLSSGKGVHVTIASNLLEVDEETGEPLTSCLVCHGPAHPELAEFQVEVAEDEVEG